MSGEGTAQRADVRVDGEAAVRGDRLAPADAEHERQLEKKLTVLSHLLPLLRVLRERVVQASSSESDETP